MGSEICIVYGAIIGLAVSLLKRVPFIGKNPKVVATVVSIIVAASGLISGGSVTGETIKALVICVLTQLAGSIGTYEVAIKPVSAMFVKDKA